jgi:hypothetical protein
LDTRLREGGDAGTPVVLAQGPGTDGGIYQLIYSAGTLVRISPAGSPADHAPPLAALAAADQEHA